jgi:LPS O-antigen subunit length determinant protein (WzzB/FepE family)
MQASVYKSVVRPTSPVLERPPRRSLLFMVFVLLISIPAAILTGIFLMPAYLAKKLF